MRKFLLSCLTAMLATVTHAAPNFSLMDYKTWTMTDIQPVGFTVTVDNGTAVDLPALRNLDGTTALLVDTTAIPPGNHTIIITAVGPGMIAPASRTKCLLVVKTVSSKRRMHINHVLSDPASNGKCT